MSAPGTVVETVTDRDRVAQACAHLRGLGILAAEALPGHPVENRERLVAALRARFPGATGSVVLWSAEDDAAFTAEGRLCRSLTLFHEGAATARAVRAAFGRFGLSVTEGQRDRTLEVQPFA